jgi:hypothetical protein
MKKYKLLCIADRDKIMAEKPTACCFGRHSKVFSNTVYGCAKPRTQVLSLLFAPFSTSVMKNMLRVPFTYFYSMLLILVVRLFVGGTEQAS